MKFESHKCLPIEPQGSINIPVQNVTVFIEPTAAKKLQTKVTSIRRTLIYEKVLYIYISNEGIWTKVN